MTRASFSTSAISVIALACASTLALASEPVATVAKIQGIALVNQGADYVNAAPGMALRSGDRLMAMEGGSASIKFNDGCIHEMSDNEILTVGSATSCTDGTLAGARVGPYLAAAPGGLLGTGLIAAGVIGTVVVVGVATSDSDDDDDNRNTVSP